MKIVYYTDQIYLHGGIEKILSQKLNWLTDFTDFEVHLITTEQKGLKPCYPISIKVVKHDLGINYLRTRSYLHPLNLLKFPKHLFRLRVKLKEIEPDVVIVCNYSFGFYLMPFIASGTKTIKEYHASRFYSLLESNGGIRKIYTRIKDFVESRYSHLVLLNDDETRYYKSKNTVVIPNSIPLNINVNEPERNNIILAAGRIASVKQFDHLIKSWDLIARKNLDWNIQIYGEGDEILLNDLNNLINNRLVPNIDFMGAVSNLSEVMQKSSIYALTSSTECFPMVLLEALSCGLPIVSYDCPHGPRNIITEDEDGILVSPNCITDFSEKLDYLIQNEKERRQMGGDALKNIKRFNEEEIMQEWLYLFGS